jgi:spermidine synthase
MHSPAGGRPHPAGSASLALMAASGFAGLGYQIVWTQQCALWLGHESAAVLAVVAAFFAGLALGARVAGPRLARSRQALRWYVGCELTIASWGLVLMAGVEPVSRGLLALIGPQPAAAWQWSIAFAGTFVLLLPATAAMGATLPAMERIGAGLHAQGRSIAAHYAANTAGAVLGVLASAFWLVPAIGLLRTAAICVAINLACAGAAWWALPRELTPLQAAGHAATAARRSALLRLAATGLLGIGYEVLVVRVLSQVDEDTVYTFAMLLAIYLVGSALGAAWYARRAGTDAADPDRTSDRLLGALAAACLLGAASLWGAQALQDAVRQALGPGMTAALGAEAMLAIAAFALPTIAMGALFSHLAAAARSAGASLGDALAANTLGAALAPLVFGVLVAPWLGPKAALLLIAAGYLLLVRRRAWHAPAAWGPALAAIALLVLAPPLAFVDVPAGGRVVSYRDGAMAAVSVVEDAEGVARLRINNRQQEGSSASRFVDARQALLPLLLHPGPRRALFLGLGTGVTASAAAEDPTLQVDAVELLPEVIAASAEFTHPDNGSQAPAERLHVMAADARRFVRVSPNRYDVIVSDNFHPARSGSGALYTIEHFRAVRDRLADGGLFCQWLPLHQLDLSSLRSIVQSFLQVYPDGAAMLASNSLDTPVIGLIGHRGAGALGLARARERLARSTWPGALSELGLDDEYALLGSLVAGPAALAQFAAGAPANTDDRPVVSYQAPRLTYAPDSTPRARLFALLEAWRVAPREVLAGADSADELRRLQDYWLARDRFIVAGRDVTPSPDVRAMLAQVRAPLLDVVRISADFRPAAQPLRRMARALAATDAPAADALLAELQAAQRPVSSRPFTRP